MDQTTLGMLFESGARELVGLRGDRDGHVIELVGVRFEPGDPEYDHGVMAFAITLDGQALETAPEPWRRAEGRFPFRPDAIERVRAALELHAALDRETLELGLTSAILGALFPQSVEGSFARWIENVGHQTMLGERGNPVARAPHPSGSVEVSLDGLAVGKVRDPVLESTARIVLLDESGTCADEITVMVHWGRIEPEAFDRSPDVLRDPRLATLVSSWQELVAKTLAEMVEEDPDQLPHPLDLFECLPSLPLAFQAWVVDGIPEDPTIHAWSDADD